MEGEKVCLEYCCPLVEIESPKLDRPQDVLLLILFEKNVTIGSDVTHKIDEGEPKVPVIPRWPSMAGNGERQCHGSKGNNGKTDHHCKALQE